ncbi:MAG: sulfite exporter TauE/SafE family protein [Phycisphaeraceae bacterium]
MSGLLQEPVLLVLIALLGLLAGVLGGLLGVGGSVVMIPGLAFLFSISDRLEPNQHLFQASAMIVNVVVSIPAMMRHRRAGVLVGDVLMWMLPAALVCILLGVWISNLPVFAGADGGRWLGRLLALFLVYVIGLNICRLRSTQSSETPDGMCLSPVRGLTVGAVMGTVAGLLGIGGGAVAVPLQQVLMKLPLRQCIGNSSAVICLSAGVGAIYKNATLGQHVDTTVISWQSSLLIAALLSPTAWLGARLGAGLTHRLPLRQVRLAFICLMAVAAWKMAGFPDPF